MFLTAQTRVGLPPAEVERRLRAVVRRDGMSGISTSAFGAGQRLLTRAGFAGLSKEVAVQLLSPYDRHGTLVVAFSWEATGAFGDLFPVLDANLEVSGDSTGDTTLTLIGSYRPPAGRLGETLDKYLLNQVAESTARSFLRHLERALLKEQPLFSAAS